MRTPIQNLALILIGTLTILLTSFSSTHAEENPGRAIICHIPPGNPANVHTIVISNNALDTHLLHGDFLGKCDEETDGGTTCDCECQDEDHLDCYGCTENDECDDRLFCDGLEVCLEGNCVSSDLPCGPNTICSEGDESCLPPSGCNSDTDCENNFFCDGQETCADGFCKRGINPCPSFAYCDESRGCFVIAECLLSADCNDSIFCNGKEECVGFKCEVGTSPCEDGICNEASQNCNSSVRDGGILDGGLEPVDSVIDAGESTPGMVGGSSVFTAAGCSSTNGFSVLAVIALLGLGIILRKKIFPLGLLALLLI